MFTSKTNAQFARDLIFIGRKNFKLKSLCIKIKKNSLNF